MNTATVSTDMIAALTAERDRARSIAAHLELDLEVCRRALDAVAPVVDNTRYGIHCPDAVTERAATALHDARMALAR